jgi:hypothetical protein
VFDELVLHRRDELRGQLQIPPGQRGVRQGDAHVIATAFADLFIGRDGGKSQLHESGQLRPHSGGSR